MTAPLTDADKIALLAEKVMGCLVVHEDGGEDWFERQVTRLPAYVIHPEGGRWLFRATEGVDEQAALDCPEVMTDGVLFNPLADDASSCMLLDRLAALADVRLDYHQTYGWRCTLTPFPKSVIHKCICGVSDNPPTRREAIVLTALALVKSEGAT